MHGVGKHTCEDGTVIDFDSGGCTYDEWINGEDPKPVQELYCPYIWKNNGMNNEPFPECRFNIGLGDRISTCNHYKQKADCWKRYNAGEK